MNINQDPDKKNKYGSHVGHRTSWLSIASKPLEELEGQSILDYIKENTDFEDPSMFIASLFEEGLASRIYNNDSIARDGNERGSTTGADYNYPYSGYFDFGLDTIGNKVDDFVSKGYLDSGIKDRILIHEVGNEKGETVKTADFKNLKDVLDSKIAFLKESEDVINKYINDKDIDISDDAKEYFKYVGYNAGTGNAQKMISSFKERGYLENDKFLEDGFEPDYWKEPYKYSMRRWQGADMLRNEFDIAPKINRTTEDPITAKKLTPIEIARRNENPIDSPDRTLDTSIDRTVNGKVTDNRTKRGYINPIDTEDIGFNEFDRPNIHKGVEDKKRFMMMPEYTVTSSRLPKERNVSTQNTLPEYTVKGNYIPDAIDTSMMKKRNIENMNNPINTEDYFLGGLLGDSVGGQTAGGAINGAMGGMAMGPPGMIVGGLLGGLSSLFGAKKAKQDQLEATAQMEQQKYSNYIASSNINQTNGSNIPMAMGGGMEGNSSIMNPMLTEFNEGGSHEANPHGGIPQGMNAQGKMRTVEEGETKFKFNDGDYVFSNRISPINYEF